LFASVLPLEKAATVIREEYRGLADKTPGCLSKHANMGAWTQHYLMEEGRWNDDMVSRCPKTMEALSTLPLCESGFGYVYFSTLDPGASIRPHHGATNAKLRIQLALEVGVPSVQTAGAFLTVGKLTREYQEGKILVFDDTHLHSVTNAAAGTKRTILLVDIWHPAIARVPHLLKRIVGVFPPQAGDNLGEACHSYAQVAAPAVPSNTTPVMLDVVPRQMVLAIFKFASVRDLGMCASVCRGYKALADVDELWRQLFAGGPFFDPEMEDRSTWKERVKHEITDGVYFEHDSTAFQEIQRTRPPASPGHDYTLLKFLMVGDSGVGKTSFLMQLSEKNSLNATSRQLGLTSKS
jgi:hypothetical protein